MEVKKERERIKRMMEVRKERMIITEWKDSMLQRMKGKHMHRRRFKTVLAEMIQGENDLINNEEQRQYLDIPPRQILSDLKTPHRYCSNDKTNELDLINEKIGDEEAKEVAQFLIETPISSLKSLKLAKNNIGDEGVKWILSALDHPSCNHITDLNLGFNKMTEKSGNVIGEFLAQNTTLINLDVSFNHLGNTGVQAICDGMKKNDTLEYLDLNHTRLSGEEGGEILKDMLVKNTSLIHLELSYNDLGDEGVRAMVDGIESTLSLQTMDMWCTEEIWRKNRSSCTIQLWGNDFRYEAVLHLISSSTSLFQLKIEGCITEKACEDVIRCVGENSSIVSFIHVDEMNERCVKMLEENKYLVDLYYCPISIYLPRSSNSRISAIIMRNKKLWKKRIKWICVVNVICRVVVVGGE